MPTAEIVARARLRALRILLASSANAGHEEAVVAAEVAIVGLVRGVVGVGDLEGDGDA